MIPRSTRRAHIMIPRSISKCRINSGNIVNRHLPLECYFRRVDSNSNIYTITAPIMNPRSSSKCRISTGNIANRHLPLESHYCRLGGNSKIYTRARPTMIPRSTRGAPTMIPRSTSKYHICNGNIVNRRLPLHASGWYVSRKPCVFHLDHERM